MLKDDLPKIMSCPSCEKKAVLVDKECTAGKNGIVFDLLSYDCICGESFTTTETDTISLNRFTKANRIHNGRELRKTKISRCIKSLK